jgi:uncharacterized repeat protein (TIGR03806 family)
VHTMRKVSGLLALIAFTQFATAQTPTLTGRDVGAVQAAGSFTVSGSTFTVRGSGSDIWYSNDDFFFAYTTLNGDGVITARVASLSNTNAWAKAGVMMRESLNANARFGFALVTPGNGSTFQYRTTTGGNAAPEGVGATSSAPYWVRVQRQGTTVRGYLSPDGVTWTLRNSATLSNLTASLFVGLAVTAHNDGTLATATFDNVSISGAAPPPPDTTAPSVPQNLAANATSTTSVALTWSASSDAGGSGVAGYRVFRNGGSTPIGTVTSTSYTDSTASPNTSYSYTVAAYDVAGNQSLPSAAAKATTPATPPPPSSVTLTGADIGAVGAAGSFTTAGTGAFTVRGSGADVWGTSDEFFFAHSVLNGDGEITARLASVTATNAWTKAGVMLRETLAGNARYAFMLVTPSNGIALQYRTVVGGSAAPDGVGVAGAAPHWVRVRREGSLIRGFMSPDGVNWTQRATVTLTGLSSSVYVGLAVTSHQDGTLATAQFQNTSISGTGSTPDTTAPSVPQNPVATASSSTSITVGWSASTDTGGSGLAGYRVFRNSTQVGGTITTTQFNDTGLTPATAYNYTVRAVDNAGNVSAASATASATTSADATAPTAPGNLRQTAVTSTSASLAWNASTDTGGSGLAGYRVFRNGTQTGAQTTGLTFTDSGLTAGTTYSYVVRAVDNAGNLSANSNSLSVTTTSTGGQSGLDSRPNNATCLAPNQPNLGTSVAQTRVFPNLSFTSPILMLQAPGNSAQWYVVQQNGVIRRFDNVNNTTTVTTFADLQDRVNDNFGEAGLLGMAFDPAFATNGRVYLSYTANPAAAGSVLQSRISRFTVSGGVLNPASEQILLTIAQPFDNHNGGNIAFGPDGLLYGAFGDGGSGGDPQNNAQNRSTLLGKLVRIDVSGTGAYTIPADNPYAGSARCNAGTATGGALCPEIYAYGLRNPWRFSFDRSASTPDIWLADVGQGAWEEVNRIERGGNYGWRFREGRHCFNPSTNCPTTANGAPLIDPVAEYSHSLGVSVTGGYVYRGTAISSLVGRYVFGDFGSGRVFALIPNASSQLQVVEILASGRSISSFGQGNDGELYIVDYSGGLYKLVPGTSAPVNTIPTLLSQTGCFDSSNPSQPATALIPYAPSAPFWSDGASKIRWMALPNSTQITVQASGDWTFPNGTVLAKHFELNGQLIETRLFMRHPDTGNWGGYTYRWNASGTDANLVSGGLVTNVGSQPWTYPSEAQCLQCHTNAAGNSLGLETSQLNFNFTYPSTGRTANQLTTLQTIGMFTAAPASMPVYPNPSDTSQPLASRARSYLHTNCSQCHRPSGGTPVNLDLRFATAIASTNSCNVTPTAGNLGVTDARIIAPGAAARSVLYLRMSRRDATQMPPVGSHIVDTQGAALLQQWINGMSATCQ